MNGYFQYFHFNNVISLSFASVHDRNNYHFRKLQAWSIAILYLTRDNYGDSFLFLGKLLDFFIGKIIWHKSFVFPKFLVFVCLPS
jgi:hypothetical protein